MSLFSCRVALHTTLVTMVVCVARTSFAEQPNVVIILADDLGYGDVKPLNPQSKIPTPNFDQLAQDGMTFTDSHSPSAVCTPTRYGLITGRYCWRTSLKRGVIGGYSPPLLDDERTTIAEMLHQQGYTTGAIGKWHLGMSMKFYGEPQHDDWGGDPGIDFSSPITNSPIHHGFDYYFGHSASLDMAPYVFIRNDRFTKVPNAEQSGSKGTAFVRQGPRADDFVIEEVLDRLTQESVAFIRKSAKQDKPFFLYFPLTAPHKPVSPHPRFQDKTTRGRYGDFVHQVDWTVGQVMRAIDDAGIREKTLLIVTSDNGSFMHAKSDAIESNHLTDSTQGRFRPSDHQPNGPLRGTKADIYEAGHRVPFFARWAGRIVPGSRNHQTICHVDLFATIAEVTGYAASENVAEDSHSFLPLLMGEETERAEPVIHHSAKGMFAIRQGNWKLIAGNGSGGRAQPQGKPFERPFQLFDLKNDLGESNNLAAQYPDMVAAMLGELENIRERSVVEALN